MSRVVVAVAGLARGAAPELIKRLERAGMITPLARDRSGAVWVDAEARQKVERVQSLIAAGYAERDIALVIGRVEKSSAARAPLLEVVGLGELAEHARVGAELVQTWVAQALLEPWAITDRGEPMFARPVALDLARALAALHTLGLGDEARTWARASRGELDAAEREALPLFLARVKKRVADGEAAAAVLRKLLPRLRGVTRGRARRRLLARRKPAGE